MEKIGTILAMNIFIISTLVLLFFLDEEGAFTKFMHIGPEKNTTFLNIKLDSWAKVVLVYIISFGSSFLQYFYTSHIQTGFIMSKLTNAMYGTSTKTQKLDRILLTVGWLTVIFFVRGLLNQPPL